MKLWSLFARHRGEQSLFRTVTTVLVLALATILMLATIAVGQGWSERSHKSTILEEFAGLQSDDSPTEPILYLSNYSSEYDGDKIQDIGIAQADPTQQLPASFDTLPRPGELLATPALKRLIDTHADLAARYEGFELKTITKSSLVPSPSSLIAIRVLSPQAAAQSNEPAITATTPSSIRNMYAAQERKEDSSGPITYSLVLMIAVMLLLPILLLVAEVARIGIVQREKRYATLSLVGASRAQINSLIIADSLPLSVLGVAIGASAYWLAGAPLVNHLPIGGQLLWPQDTQLSAMVYLSVAGTLILCSVITSWASIRSVNISPLQVSRSSGDIKPPRIWSLAPLATGIGLLGYLHHLGYDWYSGNTDTGNLSLLCTLVLILLGTVWAGAYLTRLCAKLFARMSTGASSTLAAYRLHSVSRKSFHTVSGIIIALFVGTLLFGLLSSFEHQTQSLYKTAASSESTEDDLYPLQTERDVWIDNISNDFIPQADTLATKLRSQGLITNAYAQKYYQTDEDDRAGNYYESCTQFARRTDIRCNDDILAQRSPFVATNSMTINASGTGFVNNLQFTPVDNSNPSEDLPGSYVFTATDLATRQHVINAANSLVATQHLQANETHYVSYEPQVNYADELNNTLSYWRALIMAPIAVVLLVGGLNIFVSIVGSIFARKRTFTRLSILGASNRTLAWSLLFEALLPLVVLTLFVVGIALVVVWMFIGIMSPPGDAQSLHFALPGWSFWAGIELTISLCAALLLVTIPMISRLVDSNDIRVE